MSLKNRLNIRYIVFLFLTLMLYACSSGNSSGGVTPEPTPTVSPSPSPSPQPQSGKPSIANVGTVPIINESNSYIIPIYNNSDYPISGLTFKIVSNQINAETQKISKVNLTASTTCDEIAAHSMCEYVIESSDVAQYMSDDQGSINLIATDSNGDEIYQEVSYQNLSNQITNNGVEFSSSLLMPPIGANEVGYATAYLFNTSNTAYSIESFILNNPNLIIANRDSIPAIINPGQVITLVVKVSGAINDSVPQIAVQSASTTDPTVSFVSTTTVAQVQVGVPLLAIGMIPLINTTKTDSVIAYVNNKGTQVANISSVMPSESLSITNSTCSTNNQIQPQGNCELTIKTSGVRGSGIITINYDNGASISQSVTWYSQNQPVLTTNTSPTILLMTENVPSNLVLNVSNKGDIDLDNPQITSNSELIQSITPMSSTCGVLIPYGTSCAYQINLKGTVANVGQIPFVISGTYGVNAQSMTVNTGITYQSIANTVQQASLVITSNPKSISIVGDSASESTIVFTITNYGNANANIPVAPALSPATNFLLLASTCGSSLGSGASCTQTYRYGPTATVQATSSSGYSTLNVGYSDGTRTNLSSYQIATQIIASDLITHVTSNPYMGTPIPKSGSGSTFTLTFNTNPAALNKSVFITPVNSNFIFTPSTCTVTLANPSCSISVVTISESVVPGNVYSITFMSNSLVVPESANIHITYTSSRVGESMPLPSGSCNPCGLVNGLAIANGNILASFSNGNGIYTVPVITTNSTTSWTYYNKPFAHQVLSYEPITNILYGVGGNDAQVFSYNPYSLSVLDTTYTTQVGAALSNAGAVQYGLAVWESTIYVAGTDNGGALLNPPICYGQNSLTSSQAYTCVNNNNESSYTNSLLQANGYLYQGRGDYSVWYVKLNNDHSIPTESSAWRRLGVTPVEKMGYNNSRVFGLVYDAANNKIYMAGSPKKGWEYGIPAICSIQATASDTDNWNCVELNTDPILRLVIDPNDPTSIYGSTYNNSVIRFKL